MLVGMLFFEGPDVNLGRSTTLARLFLFIGHAALIVTFARVDESGTITQRSASFTDRSSKRLCA